MDFFVLKIEYAQPQSLYTNIASPNIVLLCRSHSCFREHRVERIVWGLLIQPDHSWDEWVPDANATGHIHLDIGRSLVQWKRDELRHKLCVKINNKFVFNPIRPECAQRMHFAQNRHRQTSHAHIHSFCQHRLTPFIQLILFRGIHKHRLQFYTRSKRQHSRYEMRVNPQVI